MNTLVIWALWIVTVSGTPIPLSYHGTEAGCKATKVYVQTLTPARLECIPGDYEPTTSKPKGIPL